MTSVMNRNTTPDGSSQREPPDPQESLQEEEGWERLRLLAFYFLPGYRGIRVNPAELFKLRDTGNMVFRGQDIITEILAGEPLIQRFYIGRQKNRSIVRGWLGTKLPGLF